MKKRITIISSIALLSLFTACTGGDHSASSGKDTAQSNYDAPKSVDTTTATGNATDVDNSGSGGTKIDTPKKKMDNKK
jgi:ABC-type oligopeptide transport system substrate-binding subunit